MIRRRSGFPDGASPDERAAAFQALCHMVHDMDGPAPEAVTAVGEALLLQLDSVMNGASAQGWLADLDRSQVRALWAALWAEVRDIHQPMMLLEEEIWTAGERMLDVLNDDPEVVAALGHTPDATAKQL